MFNKLKNKVKIFEKLTNCSLDRWIENFAGLEHSFHSRAEKIGVLQNKLDLLQEQVDFQDEKIKLVREEALAKAEKDYYHQLHLNIERIEKENREFLTDVVGKLSQNKSENKIEIIK